jgi:N-acetyl-alpha-D-muramate 1-phosphate uridylyltransferase
MTIAMPHTALVLAAGLGTRMRPLTDDCPKPLIKLRGKALIDRMLDPLAAAGVQRVFINVHYLADQVEAHVAARTDLQVIISDERSDVLETGGAIAKVRGVLGDDPVMIANTDAFWSSASPAPLHALADAFDPARMDELLLLADTGQALGFDGAGDFFLNTRGELTRRGEAATAPFAYCGVRILRPQIYNGRAAERFSATRIWDALIPQARVHGIVLSEFWLHVGDPQAVKDAEMWLACHGQ